MEHRLREDVLAGLEMLGCANLTDGDGVNETPLEMRIEVSYKNTFVERDYSEAVRFIVHQLSVAKKVDFCAIDGLRCCVVTRMDISRPFSTEIGNYSYQFAVVFCYIRRCLSKNDMVGIVRDKNSM